MRFSEESELLIQHWDTFQDVMRAYERLEEEEIPELVQWISRSIEDEPWSDGWELRGDNPLRVRYYNPNWMVDDSTVLNVGTGKLRPNALFGSDDPPELRVLVWAKYGEFAAQLLEEIERRRLLKIGEPEHNQVKVNIIYSPIQKCPPRSPEGYAEAVHGQALAFFEHYLPALMSLDDVIQEELGRYRS
ncbi:MAG: hypothetical protein ACQER1_16305 [Armatimonadota bacterium]